MHRPNTTEFLRHDYVAARQTTAVVRAEDSANQRRDSKAGTRFHKGFPQSQWQQEAELASRRAEEGAGSGSIIIVRRP